MRVGFACIMLLFATPALADNFAGLPARPGRDITVKVCSQCHSPELVKTQQLDADGWKALVNQMTSNGAQATDTEFDTIIKYLAANFPPSRRADAPPLPSGASASSTRRNDTSKVSITPVVPTKKWSALAHRTQRHLLKPLSRRRLPDQKR
jgi:hypothetical protein